MRRLLAPSLASALLVTAAGASGCCFCNNPFAVAALEDRETQLAAEVRDLEKALSERRRRTLPALQDALSSGSGFSAQNLPADRLTLRWQSKHGGVPLRGQLVSQGDVSPEAPGTLRITQAKRRR